MDVIGDLVNGNSSPQGGLQRSYRFPLPRQKAQVPQTRCWASCLKPA